MARKKILVIDDEPGIREELKLWLEDLNYQVTTASNGLEGLERLKETKPHLIILDIIMPRMDGFDFLFKIKRSSETYSLPVIVLSARPETASILKSLELQATDYVIKPFNQKELLKLIKRYENSEFTAA